MSEETDLTRLIAFAKADVLKATATAFEHNYHGKFSGNDVARILRAAAAEALDLVQDEPTETPAVVADNAPADVSPCPECTAGKCGNCDGTSWDVANDVTALCPCADADHPTSDADEESDGE